MELGNSVELCRGYGKSTRKWVDGSMRRCYYGSSSTPFSQCAGHFRSVQAPQFMMHAIVGNTMLLHYVQHRLDIPQLPRFHIIDSSANSSKCPQIVS
jgi:hypothetical protein